ncbi:hypothetical protein CGRA01v4_04273 [Colletotrichum graminicola]|nr:hypothetical protein CGRA01v4_04273 [Colletotrichum graminicola]
MNETTRQSLPYSPTPGGRDGVALQNACDPQDIISMAGCSEI